MGRKYLFATLLVLACIGGYLFWDQYNNSGEELALQDDRVGGKTPGETLNLFIIALEKNDMSLAASYFIDTDDIKKDDWRQSFEKIKEQGFLGEMIVDLKKSIPDPKNSGSLEYRFLLDENNPQGGSILLKYNSYTEVWKIQTL